MNEKELDELLAGHALHALSAEEERRLEEALAADPGMRRRAERDLETAALLADAAPEVAPPARIRSELLARVARQGKDEPVTPGGSAPASPAESTSTGQDRPEAAQAAEAASGHAAPGRRRRRVWFALAASVALLLVIGFGAVSVVQNLGRDEAVIALERIDESADAREAEAVVAGGGTLTLRWSPSSGEAVVVPEEMPALDEGKQYELWYVRGETPVSAGLFDGGTDAPRLLSGEIRTGDAVAVTVEDEGGSPSGAPTTDPLAVVPTE